VTGGETDRERDDDCRRRLRGSPGERSGFAVLYENVRMAIRGEGTVVISGVTPEEVFDFVIDPAQYTKADTKMIWVTKLADTDDGMIAREDGRFLGRFRGSVVTRYRWQAPHRIDVTLEHGVPSALHAWFEIEAIADGTRLRHVETMDFGHGVFGHLYDLVARRWFARSVGAEVAEIGRLLEAGERGRGIEAHQT